MTLTRTRVAAVVVGAALALASVAGCSSTRTTNTPAGGSTSANAAGTLVGIAMPTKSLERWNRDGSPLEDLLKKAGYQTSLQYADNKVDQQVTQLQNMVNQGAKVLVVASIDGKALGLKDGKGPCNLEPFAGSPDDNNAKFFFSGAWDVLNPYVQSGKLVVPSGKAPATNADWTKIGIQEWKSETAQSEMQNRINSFYAGGKKIQVVLSPNDSLALGIAQALDAAGYKPGGDWPVLTGQDADKAHVLNMLQGKQSMTVWKDTRALGDQVAKMVDQIVKKQTVDVNDTKTYDNGTKVVPTYLLAPQVVTKDTVKSALVDSGFYSASDLGL